MYRWQALDADHVRYPLCLYPDALPDALSHTPCNRHAGWVLMRLLHNVTITHGDDQSEGFKVQVLASVTQSMHAWRDKKINEQKEINTRTSRNW